MAVSNGYGGTEQEWLVSLQGSAGLTETDVQAIADAGDSTTLTTAKSYADTKSAAAVSTANAYTDSKFAGWNDSFLSFQRDVDARFARQDQRIDRIGAMGGAMAAAALNTAGLPGQNRVGVGVGVQGGKSAIAVGYQRIVRPNISVSLSGAFSGGESSVSAGTGFSW